MEPLPENVEFRDLFEGEFFRILGGVTYDEGLQLDTIAASLQKTDTRNKLAVAMNTPNYEDDGLPRQLNGLLLALIMCGASTAYGQLIARVISGAPTGERWDGWFTLIWDGRYDIGASVHFSSASAAIAYRKREWFEFLMQGELGDSGRDVNMQGCLEAALRYAVDADKWYYVEHLLAHYRELAGGGFEGGEVLPTLREACESGNTWAVRYLVEGQGADPNQELVRPDGTLEPLVYHTLWARQFECVAMLIRCGCNHEFAGLTLPYMIVCSQNASDDEMITMLQAWVGYPRPIDHKCVHRAVVDTRPKLLCKLFVWGGEAAHLAGTEYSATPEILALLVQAGESPRMLLVELMMSRRHVSYIPGGDAAANLDKICEVAVANLDKMRVDFGVPLYKDESDYIRGSTFTRPYSGTGLPTLLEIATEVLKAGSATAGRIKAAIEAGGRGQEAESGVGGEFCTTCRNEHVAGDPEFFWCAHCRFVTYCSQECQKRHWPEHKRICKQSYGWD